MKRELNASVILAIIIFSSFTSLIMLNESDPAKVEDLIDNTKPKVLDPIKEQPTQDLSTTKGVINYDTWYPGETVRVDYSPASLFIPSEYSYNLYNGDPDGSDPLELCPSDEITWTLSNYKQKTHKDDSYYWLLDGDWVTDPKGLMIEVEFILPVFRTGALHHDFVVTATNTNSDTQSDTQDATATIGSEHIGSDGITCKIVGDCGRSTSTPEYVEAKLEIFDRVSLSWDEWGSLTDWGTHTYNMESIELKVYYFEFEPTDITENVRSSYKYSSPTTKIHEISLFIADPITTTTIYKPGYCTYSSINPYAVVSESTNLVVTQTITATYTLLLTSNCSNHLAIKDVSSTYLTDVGFEGGTKDDLSNVLTAPFDSFTVSTDIVSEGYYSLKGVDTEASTDVFNFLFDYRGKVYCSFDYYLLSGYTWSDFKVYWRISDSSWDYQTITFGSSERWNKEFLCFDLLGCESANNRNFVLQFTEGQGSVYIDNLRFSTTSTTIKTTQSSEYELSSELISWDGYKNPLLEGQHLLNTTILERSSQTMEYTTNLTSTAGIFELEYNQALEQKEYEVWTYSYSSGEFNNCSFYFTPSYPTHIDYAETELNDAWDFSEGDIENFVPVSDARSSVSYGNNGLLFQNVSTSYNWWWMGIRGIDNGGTIIINADYYTILEIRVKTVTSGDQHELVWIDDGADGSVNLLTSADLDSLNYRFGDGEYTIIRINLKEVTWSTGDWSGLQREGIRIRIEREDGANPASDEDEYYDYIRLVHVDDPIIYDFENYFVLSSANDSYLYEVYSDDYYFGIYSDLELIPINNSLGTHNFTYVLFSTIEEKAFMPVTYELIYTNSIADNYYLDQWYDYDLTGSINIILFTFWGNMTLDVWDNSTQLLNDQPEGDITTFYDVTEGYHNITIEIYNGASLWDTLNFGFYIVFPDVVNIYDVELSIFTQTGLGVPFKTVRCYMNHINNSYRLPERFYTLEQNFTLYVTDYFNVTLSTMQVNLTSTYETNFIDIQILFYEAKVSNFYMTPVTVQITRNGFVTSFTIPKNSSYNMWITEGEYTILCTPVSDNYEPYSDTWSTSSKYTHFVIQLKPKQVSSRVTGAQILKVLSIIGIVLGVIGGSFMLNEKVIKPRRKKAKKQKQDLEQYMKKRGLE